MTFKNGDRVQVCTVDFGASGEARMSPREKKFIGVVADCNDFAVNVQHQWYHVNQVIKIDELTMGDLGFAIRAYAHRIVKKVKRKKGKKK